VLKNKDIVKSESGGWEIKGIADKGFPSREAARQYVRAANLASTQAQAQKEVVEEDDNAFSGAPQTDFKEVDPFSKAEAQWAKDLSSEAGDQTVN
jgi:hypothetical protein